MIFMIKIHINRTMKKNKIRLTESQLRKLVKKSVKSFINEGGHLTWKDDDGRMHTNSQDNWYGIEGATFVWHGEWSDGEIYFDYEGEQYVINANDAEEWLWTDFKEYCEENNLNPNEHSDDEIWYNFAKNEGYDVLLNLGPYNESYEMNESKKHKVRLAESQLRQIIKESVNKVLQEGWFGNVIDTVFNGGKKQEQERQQFLLDRKINIIETLLSKGDFNKAREIASELIRNGQASEEDWDEWVTCNYQTKEERNMFKPRKKSLQQQLDLRNALTTQQRSTPQQKQQQQSTQHQVDYDKATGKYYRDRNEGWALARDGHTYWTKDLNSEDARRYAQKFGGNRQYYS